MIHVDAHAGSGFVVVLQEAIDEVLNVVDPVAVAPDEEIAISAGDLEAGLKSTLIDIDIDLDDEPEVTKHRVENISGGLRVIHDVHPWHFSGYFPALFERELIPPSLLKRFPPKQSWQGQKNPFRIGSDDSERLSGTGQSNSLGGAWI